ncbi:MAG TPA: polysaccharide biosynthesis C-terminal domain-containing protein, partial [Bacteroidales bacterium]|nr:polysaccharide biosynthesis C-terminal domain-containing protein [Bacteroidales bacterium]
WFYPRLFNPDFLRSADVFLVYSAMIIPRLIFPQTILVGRKKTMITFISAIIELSVNIPLSLLMIKWGYNIVGVVLATFISFTIGRIYLVLYVWIKMKIKPSEYIPVKVYALYSFLLALVFILIDHRIIDIR